MRSLLPLVTLLFACSTTEPESTFEPLADPPAVEVTSSSALTHTAPEIIVEPAIEIEVAAATAAPEVVAEITPDEPAGLFSTTPDTTVADITVQDGESLALLAEWSNVTAEEIASLNDIDVNDALFPGQQLILPESTIEQVTTARVSFAQVRLDRFLDRRGGLAGLRTYRVQTGDTAWSIAREELGVPTWVLSHYNDDVSLDRLTIGQELLTPVLGDEASASLDETPDDTLPLPDIIE